MKYRAKVELWDEHENRVAVAWSTELAHDAPPAEWRWAMLRLWADLWKLVRAEMQK